MILQSTTRAASVSSRWVRSALWVFTNLIWTFSLLAQEAVPKSENNSLPPEREKALRLQVFLDRAEFGPGKIDGRNGDFTLRALELYREANGLPAPAASQNAEENKNPVVTDLDLTSVEPLYIEYTVTEADVESVGPLPDKVPEQAKLKSMPYRSVGEAIAEKFHSDLKFFEELNPDKSGKLKAGDTVTVPNVKPFELSTVQDLDPGSELIGEDSTDKKVDDASHVFSVKVSTKTNMLSVYQNEKLIAAYPVTIGSNQTESPVGDWKVSGVAKMPDFRYDKAMLERGERSDDFHILPSGPNNPVGVIWIQLNKKGIGLHGTSAPDTIGRSESHGCVRLANWDVIRLAEKVKAGVAVEIQ